MTGKMKASEKSLKMAQFSGCKKLLIRERIKNWHYNCEKQLNKNINLSILTAINYEQINRNEKMAKVIFNVTKKIQFFDDIPNASCPKNGPKTSADNFLSCERSK